MRTLFALLAILGMSGCSLLDDGIHAATGESRAERQDRHALEQSRQTWSTPGRTPYEVETEARGSFRRQHGREPSLNWTAR